jgi:hypothetical protein
LKDHKKIGSLLSFFRNIFIMRFGFLFFYFFFFKNEKELKYALCNSFALFFFAFIFHLVYLKCSLKIKGKTMEALKTSICLSSLFVL